MRALVLLACVALGGCEWDKEAQKACQRTPGCDAGVSADAGEPALQARALGEGSLIGLSALNDYNAWVVIKPSAGGGLAFNLSPEDGGWQATSLAVPDPRALFGARGLNSYAVVDASGQVSLHAATGAKTSTVTFSGLEPQLVSQYSDDAGALSLSVWGTSDAGEYRQAVAINQGPPTAVDGGCGQPTFHDVEVLRADLKGGALLALHTEVVGCTGGPFTTRGAWLEHISNLGVRRGLLLADATGESFGVGRLERSGGEPLPVVGYATQGGELVVFDVDTSGSAALVVTSRGSVRAGGARFGDFVRGSQEPIFTGVASGDVRLASDAGLSAIGGATYAFVARLTQPGWVKRLGPVSGSARVLGVKVGTTAIVVAWESPTGVVWTTLAEDDGRELQP